MSIVDVGNRDGGWSQHRGWPRGATRRHAPAMPRRIGAARTQRIPNRAIAVASRSAFADAPPRVQATVKASA
jgi:hypothetical protein